MKSDTKALRIKPLLPPPDKQKISFKLPAPTVADFQSYLAAYAEIYGMDADPDFVADQIFTAFFASDKSFAAYLKKGSAADHSGSGAGKTPAVVGGGTPH